MRTIFGKVKWVAWAAVFLLALAVVLTGGATAQPARPGTANHEMPAFRAPAEVMRFIDDQKIPTGADRLSGAGFFLRKQIDARENELILLERIAFGLV